MTNNNTFTAERTNAQTLDLSINGLNAIEAVANIAGSTALTLAKHSDPIDDAEQGITLERAAEVAREDGQLVYLQAEVEWFGNAEETVARCGHLVVTLRQGEAARVTIGGDLPVGAVPLSVSSLEHDMPDVAARALVEHIAAIAAPATSTSTSTSTVAAAERAQTGSTLDRNSDLIAGLSPDGEPFAPHALFMPDCDVVVGAGLTLEAARRDAVREIGSGTLKVDTLRAAACTLRFAQMIRVSGQPDVLQRNDEGRWAWPDEFKQGE